MLHYCVKEISTLFIAFNRMRESLKHAMEMLK